MLLTKRAHQSTIFQILGGRMTFHPINYAILHHFSVIKDHSSVFFLAQTSYSLDKNSQSSKICGFLSGRVKIHQIPHAIFGTKSQFFF